PHGADRGSPAGGGHAAAGRYPAEPRAAPRCTPALHGSARGGCVPPLAARRGTRAPARGFYVEHVARVADAAGADRPVRRVAVVRPGYHGARSERCAARDPARGATA